jgi:hypothetical protein
VRVTRSGQSVDETEQIWPDCLETDDRLKFDGNEYVVIGTGPTEATLERVDNGDYTIKVGRWAFTDAVYVELEISMSQDEFARSVQTGVDRSEGGGDGA